MTLLHQAAQKAVEALKLADGILERRGFYVEQISVALVNLQAALRQSAIQQPEPVALSTPRCPLCGGSGYGHIEMSSALQQEEVPREPVAVTEEMKHAGVDEMFLSDTPTGEAWEEKMARVYLRMHAAGASPSTTRQQEPQWGPILDALDGWSNDSRDEDYAHLARLVRTEHARTLDRLDATQQQEAGNGFSEDYKRGWNAARRLFGNAAPSTPESAEKDDAGGGKESSHA